jgi:hypothetical protein
MEGREKRCRCSISGSISWELVRIRRSFIILF